MSWEYSDRRVLGAFRFIDNVTGLPVGSQMSVRLADEPERSDRVWRNRLGVYVLSGARGFEDYTTQFDDVPVPARQNLRLRVDDTDGLYLPREFDFMVPEVVPGTPARVTFNPAEVRLFRSPAAPASDTWTVLRVALRRGGQRTSPPLPGALVRVLEALPPLPDPPPADPPVPRVLGQGITEWRGRTTGEALVALAGIPVATWGKTQEDAVVAVGTEVNLVVHFDKALALPANHEWDPQIDAWPDVARMDATAPPAGITRSVLAQSITVKAGEERTLVLGVNAADQLILL